MKTEKRYQAVMPILCFVLGVAFACLLFAKIILAEYKLPGRDPDGNFIVGTKIEIFSFYILLCEQSHLYWLFYAIFAIFVLTACFGVFGLIVHFGKIEKFAKFARIGSETLLIVSCLVAFVCWEMSFYLIPLA